MNTRGYLIVLVTLIATSLGCPRRLGAAPDDSPRQLIVGIAPTWDSKQGTVQGFERDASGAWKPTLGPFPVMFGKNGLAWGRGIRGNSEVGLHKEEHDGRAPAGLFNLGTIYTYDPALPEGSKYPFHTVNDRDAWIDDPSLPNYNEHITIPDAGHPPEWFDKMKMRQGDFAYRWLVEIRHNASPIEPGAGSAIFFHIRRGVDRPTSGCTTMAQDNLVKLIRWLRADQHPEYVLLPRGEYQKKWTVWGLPEPASLTSSPTER